MRNFIKFILFFVYFNICVAEEIKLKSKNEISLKKDNSSFNKELPEILGTPEALIRYRHHKPITIIKQKAQKIKRRPKPKLRRRVKQPKIKYGPPGFINAEPLSYPKLKDNVHKNHPSGSLPFTSSSNPNEYENFYKELGSDFNFEDVAFSEYEKEPIKFDLYNEKFQKYLLQQKFNQHRVNEREKFQIQNQWTDVSASHGIDYQETYDIPEESYWHHSPKQNDIPRKPVTYHKSSFTIDMPWEKHKDAQKEYYIPHTKYGVPLPVSDGELVLPKKKKQYHFGEPPQDGNLYDKPLNVENYFNKNNKVKVPYLTAPKMYTGNTNHQSSQNMKPPKYIQPPEDYNTYMTESSHYNNDFQEEKHIFSHQQELPLQNEAKFAYDFSKSSYDVPLYDAMPFRNEDQLNDNYPPLNDSYSIISESQGLPSKISAIYAATNSTLSPPEYFTNKPYSIKNISRQKFTENSRKNIPYQTRINNKINRTKKRRTKNQNTENLSTKMIESNIPYNEDYSNESDQNVKKFSTNESVSSTKNVPLNLLLLSSANRNPGSHISSSKWDPLKVTSYHFEIDHDNISASIPNIKLYRKTKERITTPTYKKRAKTRRNSSFDDIVLNTTKMPYLQNVYTKTIPPEYFIRKTNEMIFDKDKSGANETNSSEYSAENNNLNERKNLNNLKLIQDPFNYKNNVTITESYTQRYKNHRYY